MAGIISIDTIEKRQKETFDEIFDRNARRFLLLEANGLMTEERKDQDLMELLIQLKTAFK